MPRFNLDEWWDINVDFNLTPLDHMYKKITQEAINDALKLHRVIEEDENAIDLDDIDLSDVL